MYHTTKQCILYERKTDCEVYRFKTLDSCQIYDCFASSMPVLQHLPNYISQCISLEKSFYDSLKNQLEKLTQLIFS